MSALQSSPASARQAVPSQHRVELSAGNTKELGGFGLIVLSACQRFFDQLPFNHIQREPSAASALILIATGVNFRPSPNSE
jgi:hypothetical protein